MQNNNDIRKLNESYDSGGVKKWDEYDEIICPDGKRINMQEVVKKINISKAALNTKVPSFGGLIAKLNIVYTFQIPTMATDALRCFINPQFADSLTAFQCVMVFCHEIMHCMLNHCARMQGASMSEHEKINIAADYEVNDTMVEAGICTEANWKEIGGFFDKKYFGWAFEDIYKDIASRASQSMSNQKQAQQAQKNQQGQQNQQGQKNQQGQQGQQGRGGSSSGSGGQQQARSADWKAGWAQAVADIKSGKIKV